MKSLFSLVFFVVLLFPAAAQTDIYIDSHDIAAQGMAFVISREYTKAIAQFEQISPNDTNYTLAQLEMVLSHFELNHDSTVVQMCNKGIAWDGEWDHLFREYLIESLTRLKDSSALKQIVLAQRRYPFNEDFILLEATALQKWGRYDESATVLQNLILRNPFNKNAHYFLGQMMADKGDFIRATLSLESFLMLSAESNVKTSAALVMLSNIFKNKHDVTIKNAKKNNLFKDEEELMESGLALKDGYQSEAPLDDPIVRQSDVLMKNLTFQKGSNDFWMNLYVPFFVKVKEQGMIRAYTYQFLSFLDHKELQKGVKKFAVEIEKFRTFATAYFEKINEVSTIVVLGKSVTAPKYYDAGNMLSTGKKNGDTRSGTWYFFYESGALESVLSYDNAGNKVDSAYDFYSDGKIKTRAFYVADLLEGKYSEYYANGELKTQLFYKGDSLDGLQKTYYANGAMKESIDFKNGQRHGSDVEYDNAGNKETELWYSQGELEGVQKGFYPGAILKSEVPYKAGLREGAALFYHKNGKLSSKGKYLAGKALGPWEDYFSNGKMERSYFFNAQEQMADSVCTFYTNGKVESKTLFNKEGVKEGNARFYSCKGKLLSEFNYKKDLLKSYSYYSPQGTLLSAGNKTMLNYDDYGHLSSKGEFKNGKRIGRWEFYYPNGEISAIGTYTIAGDFDGLYENYYQSGVVKDRSYYNNGMLNGRYTSYHENGRVKSEGWYKEGQNAGQWMWYYSNGMPEQKSYFTNGETTGELEDYNADSTLDYVRKYKDGHFQSIHYYDAQGKLTAAVDTKNGNGTFTYMGENNVVEYQRSYQYSVLHGKAKKILKNGILLAEENYVHGVLDGPQSYRYPNGQISLQANYIFGDEQGTWKYFNEDGSLSLERHYSFGNLCDSSLWYFPSGSLQTKKHYNDMGQESGLSTWYYENGKIKKESDNAFNEREGWTTDYDPQGRVICKRFFENGNTAFVKGLAANGKDSLFYDVYKQSDSLTTYYDSGKPALSCRYDKGLLQGQYIKYFYNGNILEVANIEHDFANGKSTDYYANGKMMQQENYICNTQHGQQLSYFENGILQKDEGRYMGNLHGTMKAYNKAGTLLVDAEYRHGMLVKNNMK